MLRYLMHPTFGKLVALKWSQAGGGGGGGGGGGEGGYDNIHIASASLKVWYIHGSQQKKRLLIADSWICLRE